MDISRIVPMFGNILIVFSDTQRTWTAKATELFRVSFNTAFIGDSNRLELKRQHISPEDVQKDTHKYSDHFRIIIEFNDFCQGNQKEVPPKPPCKSHSTKLNDLCSMCKTMMD